MYLFVVKSKKQLVAVSPVRPYKPRDWTVWFAFRLLEALSES